MTLSIKYFSDYFPSNTPLSLDQLPTAENEDSNKVIEISDEWGLVWSTAKNNIKKVQELVKHNTGLTKWQIGSVNTFVDIWTLAAQYSAIVMLLVRLTACFVQQE